MAKRKPATERRVWARIVDRQWRVNLVSGEVLTPVREVSLDEARDLAMRLAVYAIGFLMPVRDLTGDASAIKVELGRVDGSRSVGSNSASLFRGPSGTEALVFEFHH